jgi:hypothetical protein
MNLQELYSRKSLAESKELMPLAFTKTSGPFQNEERIGCDTEVSPDLSSSVIRWRQMLLSALREQEFSSEMIINFQQNVWRGKDGFRFDRRLDDAATMDEVVCATVDIIRSAKLAKAEAKSFLHSRCLDIHNLNGMSKDVPELEKKFPEKASFDQFIRFVGMSFRDPPKPPSGGDGLASDTDKLEKFFRCLETSVRSAVADLNRRYKEDMIPISERVRICCYEL